MKSWKNLFAIIVLISLAGCGVPGPNGPEDSFGINFTPPKDDPGVSPRGAIIFTVDGVSGDIFHDMLISGQMPAIEKYFTSRGLYVRKAVASTPSITLANITSIVTGRFPGHHTVVGNNWFDRKTCLGRNYNTIGQKNTLDNDYKCPNIYEQFKSEPTVSIFLQPHRGSDKFFENRLSAGPAFGFGMYDLMDRITLFRFGEMMDIARNRFNRFPALTFAYILSPDMQAYAYGVSSVQYVKSLENTSKYIGRVLGDLERAGLLKDMIIGFVSDHSMCDVLHHFNLEGYLCKTHGLDLTTASRFENTSEKSRRSYYGKYDSVLNMGGDRYGALSLRKKLPMQRGLAPWSERPNGKDLFRSYGRLMDELVELQAVDAIAYRSGSDRCRVRTKKGEAEFAVTGKDESEISYRVLSGNPFGWGNKIPATNGLSSRRWLQLTYDTDYPDLPPQILAYFRSPKSGDIAIFATPGWDFGKTNKAGHGGIRGSSDMRVPLLLAGPGVPHGKMTTARTVDLVPTLLKLVGRNVPAGLDGRSLITEFDDVRRAPWTPRMRVALLTALLNK